MITKKHGVCKRKRLFCKARICNNTVIADKKINAAGFAMSSLWQGNSVSQRFSLCLYKHECEDDLYCSGDLPKSCFDFHFLLSR